MVSVMFQSMFVMRSLGHRLGLSKARRCDTSWRRDELALPRVNHLTVLLGVVYLLHTFLSGTFVTDAHAQVNIVGASTTTNSTTPGSRKTFFDSGSGNPGSHHGRRPGAGIRGVDQLHVPASDSGELGGRIRRPKVDASEV